jgi:hypothetical protein
MTNLLDEVRPDRCILEFDLAALPRDSVRTVAIVEG